LTKKDKRGHTLLHYALWFEHNDIAELLKNAGAKDEF